MQGRRSAPHRLVASLLAVASTACYTYAPLEEGRPSPGDEVRVHVAAEGEEGTGGEASRSRELRGLVVESRDDTLHLSVRVQPSTAGTFDVERRESARVAYAAIQRIERPRLDGLRTGAFVVGGLGLLAGFMAIILNGDDTGVPGDGGGGGPSLDLRAP